MNAEEKHLVPRIESHCSEREINEFFEALFGQAERGYLSLWQKDTKTSKHFSLPESLEAAANYAAAIGQGADVYFGVGVRSKDLGVNRRGSQADIEAIPGLWADIDIRGPGHKNVALPPDADSVLEWLRSKLEFPPSLVVESGGGVHAYWLFREPWVFDNCSELSLAKDISAGWQHSLLESAGLEGWELDNVGDLPRILRPAGTLNHKTGAPKAVKILYDSGKRYDPSDFGSYRKRSQSGKRKSWRGRLSSDEQEKVRRPGRIPEGKRNNSLASLAGELRNKGWSQEETLGELLRVNSAKCNPPLPDREVEQIAASISKYRPDATDEPQVSRLLNLVQAHEVDLFRDADGNAWATAPVDRHRETFALCERGGGLRNWSINRFREAEGRPPGSSALSEATAACYAKAMEATVKKVALRIAEMDEVVWIDLCNDRREVVKVTGEGWTVTTEAPTNLCFRRPHGMAALPRPEYPGTVEPLRELLNLSSERDFLLVVAWLLACLRPGFPYPLLALSGEQGTGKSTVARLLRLLVDPQGEDGTGLARPPKDERDLFTIAWSNHLLAFDNLSSISKDMSDAFCNLLSGGGFQSRRLYKDVELFYVFVRRPVCLNSIGSVAERSDLQDRALLVNLRPLSVGQRLSEDEYWKKAKAAAPVILGGLLTATSTAMRRKDEVCFKNLPRMADFAVWIAAAEPALPWETGAFEKAYAQNRTHSSYSQIEQNAFSRLLCRLAQEEFSGTTSDALKSLESLASHSELQQKDWPSTESVAGKKMKRLAPALRSVGFEASWRTLSGRTHWTLRPANHKVRQEEGSSDPSSN
jgi:hypothetical protein